MIGMFNKETHTFDLRFRHDRHAASVCLPLAFDGRLGFGLCVCVVVAGGGGEIGVVMAVLDHDGDDDDDDSCEERRFDELTGIESASTFPGNVG